MGGFNPSVDRNDSIDAVDAGLRDKVRIAVATKHMQDFPGRKEAIDQHFDRCSLCSGNFQELEALDFKPRSTYHRAIIALISP